MGEIKKVIMQKKGQIIEMVGVLIVLAIVIYAGLSIGLDNDQVYVGFSPNNTAYKYTECRGYIESLPKEAITVFQSKKEIPNRYTISGCE